jgi:uncharacterized protein DUF3300
MKAIIRFALAWLPALCVSVALAQTAPSAPHREAAMQAELDQLLAPIALYPDSLLSQILMASTYPLEVVEAARWSKANPGLKGEDAVAAVEQKDWDPSVKSLVAFPQVLVMMDERLEWTERLGDVFIAQEPQVMETVQTLRQKAYAAGNLQSTEQAYVTPEAGAIAIEPASPQVVYVPYYDPWTVYGTWWWPAYPPVFWAPWPGYIVSPGFVLAWGAGVAIGPRFFFSACDWHARRVTVVNVTVNRPGVHPAPPTVWRHDPGHRRGVPYHIESVRREFGPANRAQPGRQFQWRNSVAPATRNSALNRPETQPAHPRPGAPSRQLSSPPAARPPVTHEIPHPPAYAPSRPAVPQAPAYAPRPSPPAAALPQSPARHEFPHPPGYAPRPVTPAPGASHAQPAPGSGHAQPAPGYGRAPPAGRQQGEGRGR